MEVWTLSLGRSTTVSFSGSVYHWGLPSMAEVPMHTVLVPMKKNMWDETRVMKQRG